MNFFGVIDIFICAYERSTQECVAIRQQLAESDRLRLTHRTPCVPWCCSDADAQTVLARYGLRPSQLQVWQAGLGV